MEANSVKWGFSPSINHRMRTRTYTAIAPRAPLRLRFLLGLLFRWTPPPPAGCLCLGGGAAVCRGGAPGAAAGGPGFGAGGAGPGGLGSGLVVQGLGPGLVVEGLGPGLVVEGLGPGLVVVVEGSAELVVVLLPLLLVLILDLPAPLLPVWDGYRCRLRPCLRPFHLLPGSRHQGVGSLDYHGPPAPRIERLSPVKN